MFHEQTKKAREVGSQVDCLMVNYRSKPELLEFLNGFFCQLFAAVRAEMQPRRPAAEKRLVARFISGPTEQDENQGDSRARRSSA